MHMVGNNAAFTAAYAECIQENTQDQEQGQGLNLSHIRQRSDELSRLLRTTYFHRKVLTASKQYKTSNIKLHFDQTEPNDLPHPVRSTSAPPVGPPQDPPFLNERLIMDAAIPPPRLVGRTDRCFNCGAMGHWWYQCRRAARYPYFDYSGPGGTLNKRAYLPRHLRDLSPTAGNWRSKDPANPHHDRTDHHFHRAHDSIAVKANESIQSVKFLRQPGQNQANYISADQPTANRVPLCQEHLPNKGNDNHHVMSTREKALQKRNESYSSKNSNTSKRPVMDAHSKPPVAPQPLRQQQERSGRGRRGRDKSNGRFPKQNQRH